MKSVSVIGGGLAGCEAAYVIAESGIHVTMPHWVVLPGALSMTTAAGRWPGYCCSCPVRGSAEAVLSAAGPPGMQPASSTAHSTAAPMRWIQMRFMAFPSFTDS